MSAKHLENGVRQCPWKCPLALCIIEGLKAIGYVSPDVMVRYTTVEINGEKYRLGTNAQRLRRRFDLLESNLKPITFTIY